MTISLAEGPSMEDQTQSLPMGHHLHFHEEGEVSRADSSSVPVLSAAPPLLFPKAASRCAHLSTEL